MVGALDERDLLMLGALMYWCEGTKAKPWRPEEHVEFVNSDLRLVRLFLRFLRSAGVAEGDIAYRVQIHETADAEAAVHWWAERIGAPTEAFQKSNIKRHNPKTNRHQRGDDYRGCLRVSVYHSAALYRRIAAAVDAMMGRPETGGAPAPG